MTPIDWTLLAALAAAFWLLLIRPARVRRQQQARLLASLEPGVRVMTTAGLFGTVASVDADRVHLEVAPGIVLEMVPQAIGALVPVESATEPDEPSGTEGEADRG